MKFLIVLLTLVSFSANAQGLMKMMTENKKCMADIQKFCMAVMMKDKMAIMKCLQDHKAELTEDCKSILTPPKK